MDLPRWRFCRVPEFKSGRISRYRSGCYTSQRPISWSHPEESETGVCLRLEEALETTENIDRLTTTAREGGCDATVQLAQGADLNRLLNDVKGNVDAITTFPLETEKPIIRAFSSIGNVMTMALSSATNDKNLKVVAEDIRDDLLDLPEVSQVNIEFIRPIEISIEVSEFTLRQYGLTRIRSRVQLPALPWICQVEQFVQHLVKFC